MKYSDSHEWVKVREGVAVVGITEYAQKELGDIVFIELPALGKRFRAGEEAAVLESTKAAADIHTPVSGEIVEINHELDTYPDTVNKFPEGKGWLFKIKLANPSEVDFMLTKEQYLDLIG